MNKFLLVLLAVILLSGSLFISCAKSTKTPAITSPVTTKSTTTAATTTAPTMTTPQYGGVLKIISSSTPVNLGTPDKPMGSFDNMFRAPYGESLLGRVDQSTGRPSPLLATAYEISPDYKSITFTLRKGVKFSDGTDFNAQAVKYNLNKYSKATGGQQALLALVTSVDILDDYTIRMNLSSYDPTLLTAGTGPTGIRMLSPTATEKMGNDPTAYPVGTGPFKMVSYQRDVSLKYERFDGYWDKGKPYLDGIQFLFIADPVTALLSFKSGEAQVLRDLAPKDAVDLIAAGKYIVQVAPLAFEGWLGDTAHANSPFADIRVRRAICYAINNDPITKTIGKGFSPDLINNQIVPKTHYAYNPAVVGYPYNPQKARDLLKEAGYPNGFNTFVTFATNPTYLEMYTAAQGYLSAVGINLKLDAADMARYAETRNSGWASGLIQFGLAISTEEDCLQHLRNKLSTGGSWYAASSVSIPADYNAKLLDASSQFDWEKRRAKAQELMKMITDDYCLVNELYFSSSLMAESSQIHDLNMNSGGFIIRWSPQDAWLSR